MAALAERSPEPRAKILVVDDEREVRQLLRATLTREGYEVHLAASGEEAIQSLERVGPDLLILDIMMPAPDGRDVCRYVKGWAWDRFVPVLFLTALGDTDDRIEGLDCGADDYLAKPFDLRELRSRVSALMRIKQRHDAMQSEAEVLRRTGNEAQNAAALAGELNDALAYRLRNPMTAVFVAFELLARSLDGDDQRRGDLEMARLGVSQAKRVLQVIDACARNDERPE